MSCCSSGTRRQGSALAVEAAIPRQRLYEHRPEALADFKAQAGGGPLIPNQQALQQRLDDAQNKIKKLEAEKRHLEGQITALTAVIVELTHVIKLPPRRGSARSGPRAS